MEAKFIETSWFGRWVLRPLAILCFFGFAFIWFLVASTEGDLASPGRLAALGLAAFLLGGSKIAQSWKARRFILGIDGMTRPMLAAYWLSYAIIIAVLCSATCSVES